nr:DNA ligase 1-like isoform X2 [Solanum lycopersicum]
MMDEYSKSNKKTYKLEENQRVMMKINTTKNVSGIGCVILLGGALITVAAMGSAFLISRKNKKSTKNVTKKEGNEKIEDESSNKGLHFILPEQQSSSNVTDKLCHNDSLNVIVSDHLKVEEKSPSFERLELSETKISLLSDPDQELYEVSRVKTDVIQGNEKIEVPSRVHQAHATIFSNPDSQILVDSDKGESNELQRTGVIKTNDFEEDLIQEQEKQPTGDQATSICNEHEPLNSAFKLMRAADEGQCANAETQIDQIAKKCDVQNQFSDESECANENDQATSANSHCITYSMDAQNLEASEIRKASVDDQNSAEVIKEANAMDSAVSEEQSLETEQLAEKIEPDCEGNVLKENDDEEIVFVNEHDDYEDDIDKEDDAQEVEYDISEEAIDSSTQFNSDKIWLADSIQEHKVENMKEGTKIEEDEQCIVENCNLESTQNDVAITSCQQNYDCIDGYRTKLMYLNDIAAITRRRRVLLGALLVLIWYLVLKRILSSVIGGFKILNDERVPNSIATH